MRPYPMLMTPILKRRVWGGRGLARVGKPVPAGERIGESWELADLPERIEGGRSPIANGPLEGHTLREAISEHRAMIMGTARLTREGGFPLLLKYLDARENLSVQVHPGPAYARAHDEADLKSEAWYVVDALPGAVLYRGLAPGVTRERLAEDVRRGTAVDDLVALPARPGDFHYLPSGTCHALGAGIVVAEIQTPSDTTFRLYDWGREGRELHVEEALACLEIDGSPDDAPSGEPPPPLDVDGLLTTRLLRCEHFEIDHLETTSPQDLPMVTNGQPLAWMVLAGRGTASGGDVEVPLRAGSTVLFPADLDDGSFRLTAGTALLQIAPPSPLRGLIA